MVYESAVTDVLKVYVNDFEVSSLVLEKKDSKLIFYAAFSHNEGQTSFVLDLDHFFITTNVLEKQKNMYQEIKSHMEK